MWIVTKIGFFSVVEHRDRPDLVLVRARVRQDLVDLKAYSRKLESVHRNAISHAKILEFAGSDYPYRIIIEKMAFARLGWQLMADINYDNFKNAVEDRRRSNILHRVWSTLMGLTALESRAQPDLTEITNTAHPELEKGFAGFDNDGSAWIQQPGAAMASRFILGPDGRFHIDRGE